MPAREYCVYNETRENFLTLRVTVLDTKAEPLKAVKVLIEGLEPGSETGLWLNPLKSVPTVPRLSGYDLVYLDPQCRVLNVVALGADDDVPRIDGQTASALVLPIHSFSASHTHPGDKVVLHAADEFAPSASAAVEVPVCVTPDLAPVPVLPLVLQPAAPPAEAEATQAIVRHEPELLPPARALRDSPRIGLLRSIVHLRIHISISITTAPPAMPVAAATDAVLPPTVSPTGSFRARVAALAASTGGFIREHSATCSRRCGIWKRRYLRWAEQLVCGGPAVTMRPVRRVRRSPGLEEEC